MSQRFATTHQAVNLLRNGSLEMVEALDSGAQKPHFWSFDALIHEALQDAVVVNTFEVLQEDPGPAPASRFRVELVTGEPSKLYQDTTRDASVHVQDFPVPLAPSLKPALPQGHFSTEVHALPKGDYTLSFDVRAYQGTVSIDPAAWDLVGAVQTPTYPTGQTSVTLGASAIWRRITIQFSVDYALGGVGLQLERTTSSGLAVVEIGNVMLAQGHYRYLPYTGDPLLSAIPKGAIILTMGSVCPPGFEEIGEDGLEPLPEWVADEPNILARKGNYPREGTELVGTTSHTVDAVEITPGTTDALEFSGPDSKVVDGTLVDTSKSNPATDEPGGSQGVPEHDHTIETAGTRPVSRGYLLCRRI